MKQYIKYTQSELDEILTNHDLYLRTRGEKGECADLSNAYLSNVNLTGVNLREVNLTGADLSASNLQYAYLSNADLTGIDLTRANLKFAILYRANLRDADLSGTNLNNASLYGANLSNAKLHGAVLYNTTLEHADLTGVDLDFSCLPLWCGSLKANFDDRHIAQFAYHIVRAGLTSKNVSDKTKNELKKIIDLANTFHRATECGKIKDD